MFKIRERIFGKLKVDCIWDTSEKNPDVSKMEMESVLAFSLQIDIN
jgi:hypothetical protein